MNPPFQTFVNKPYPQGSIMQGFGENPALYSTICGADGTCLTGGHNGYDLVAPWGTPLFPVEAGRVVEIRDKDDGYGKMVRILSGENEWTYGHLSKIFCKVGQTLAVTECLGNMGNTGFVVSGATPYWKANPYAGTHLHLGKRICKGYDGKTYNIQYQDGTRGTILNAGNGFKGSVPFELPNAPVVQPDINQLQLTVISLANQAISLLQQLLTKRKLST